ncbi:MAG: hypothetical protein GX330_06720 [Bacteroidales bacterium]|nr:hypothetical protein [Bacteroidales bacterium]
MKKLSSILILLSIMFTGCKQIDCPNFPDNLTYLPYENGQELKFMNTDGDIRSFTIVSKENSTPYSFSSNCKCECAVYTRFTTTSNEENISMECRIDIFSRQNINVFFMHSSIGNAQLTDLMDKEVSLKEFGLTFKDYNKISKYLEDTILLENENNQLITKMVFVKNKGLASYTTANGDVWTLIE